jgi:uncharacterized membrane protein YkvA (DUF1232 family)
MDLIPDWNQGIGVIDDVMVLRVCAQLSQDYDRGSLSSSAEIAFERLANEADKISEFLGGLLYDKLKAYCAKLGDQVVKGRTASEIMSDEKARKAFYVEIDAVLKKHVPIVVNDPNDAELRLKSYLKQKLS